MDAYTKALKKIMEDKSPPPPTTLSKEQIEAGIADISERLRGPQHNAERLWLVEDKRRLQKQLAALNAAK